VFAFESRKSTIPQCQVCERSVKVSSSSLAMILNLFQLLSLLLISTHTLGARLAISIPPSQLLPTPTTLPSSTHATLQSHGAFISALLTRSNKFFFDDVAPGSYLLNVHCHDYFFEPLRIDVVANETAPGGEYVMSWQTFRGNEWDNKGEIRGQGHGADPEGVKIEVRPTGVKDYYQPRQGCTFPCYSPSCSSCNSVMQKYPQFAD